MKVLSLIQPWATLVVLGEKKIETRSWRHKSFYGDLLIHASKKVDKAICNEEPFKSVLAKHGFTADNLPTGCIIGACKVVAYSETELLKDCISPQEKAFGDYSELRWGWRLKDAEKFEVPIPAKGKLNLWEFYKEG